MAYLEGGVPHPGDLLRLREHLVEAGQLVADVAHGLADVGEAVEVAAFGLEVSDLVALLLQVVLQGLCGGEGMLSQYVPMKVIFDLTKLTFNSSDTEKAYVLSVKCYLKGRAERYDYSLRTDTHILPHDQLRLAFS